MNAVLRARPEKLRGLDSDLVLEEVVVQVPLEPSAEGDAAGLPSHRVSELQRAAHHQRLRAL